MATAHQDPKMSNSSQDVRQTEGVEWSHPTPVQLKMQVKACVTETILHDLGCIKTGIGMGEPPRHARKATTPS